MNIRTPFINSYGRLRSGWRVLILCLAFTALLMLLTAALRMAWAVYHATGIKLPHEQFAAEFVYRVMLLSAAVGAGYLCARLLEGLPWRSLGVTLRVPWFHDLIVGTVVGIVSLAIAVGIATAAGGLRFDVSSRGVLGATVLSVLGSAALFIVAALAEEAMFRGYPLQTLSRAQLAWLGVFLTSVPFATVHLWNPNVVPGVTFGNTALAGIWLGIAYLRTRSLWLPLGIHWSWNWAMGSFFGIPVSGINLVSHPVLLGKDLGPAWITGGSYGIEGGAACTVALIVSSIFVWRTRLVSSTPEQLKLTSEENPATPAHVLSIQPAATD